MASGRQIAACLFLVLIALSIAACGNDSPQGPKIPPETAAILQSKLDVVQQRMTPEKECGTEDTAQTSLNSVQGFVDQIPEEDVDPQILSDLRELLDDFDQKLAADCDAGGLAAAESTSSISTSTETTTTTTDTKATTEKTTTTEPPTDVTSTSTSNSNSTSTTPPDTTTQPEPPSPPAHSNAGGNGNGNGGATQGGFEAGGTPAPGGRIPANGGGR